MDDKTLFKIRVDRSTFDVPGPLTTGRAILTISGHTPVEQWRLDARLQGGMTRKIELDDVVDLAAPGVDRFMTLPLDQTEGSGPLDEPSN